MSADDFVVTPWHVEGEIDYDKLIKKFGTEKISPELLERIKRNCRRRSFHAQKRHFLLS